MSEVKPRLCLMLSTPESSSEEARRILSSNSSTVEASLSGEESDDEEEGQAGPFCTRYAQRESDTRTLLISAGLQSIFELG